MKSVYKEILEDEHCVLAPEVEFSVIFRLQHWIRALAITVLIATGFYLAYPMLSPAPTNEPTNFMYALFRSWHIIFGFVLISAFMLKTYIFFFGKTEAKERQSFRDLFSFNTWKYQIGYYSLLTKRPKLHGAYNPMQFAAYFLFYVLLSGLTVTGLILYVHVFHEGLGGFLYDPMRQIEVLLGGLAVVRELHHILMWGVILFVIAHLYLVTFNAIYIKEGAIDAIFSGLKWHKKH
jgi:Ni/Fe-hydrogenase 1 B-type cytochrome subunit